MRSQFIFSVVILHTTPPCATLTTICGGRLGFVNAHVHTRLRSPYTLSMRPTVGQLLRPTYIHKLKVLNAERSSSWVKMVLLCKAESLELLGHYCVHVISAQNHSNIHTYIHTYIHNLNGLVTYIVDCVYDSLLHTYIHTYV